MSEHWTDDPVRAWGTLSEADAAGAADRAAEFLDAPSGTTNFRGLWIVKRRSDGPAAYLTEDGERDAYPVEYEVTGK